MNTKQCSKCKRELPATAEFFHRHKEGKFSLRSICKTCRLQAHAVYQQTPESEALQKEYRQSKKGKAAERRGKRKYRRTFNGYLHQRCSSINSQHTNEKIITVSELKRYLENLGIVTVKQLQRFIIRRIDNNKGYTLDNISLTRKGAVEKRRQREKKQDARRQVKEERQDALKAMDRLLITEVPAYLYSKTGVIRGEWTIWQWTRTGKRSYSNRPVILKTEKIGRRMYTRRSWMNTFLKGIEL